MNTTITYTHTVILANGMQTTFQSAWPAHEVVGGLTFIKTVVTKESTFSLY